MSNHRSAARNLNLKTPAGGNIFPNKKAMKDEMREQMTKPEYDVTSYYKRTGFCQWVARHSAFEKTTLVVIGLNAIWIGIDTDLNHASVLLEAHPVFQIAEHFFCTYFLFEWSMRFGAFERKRNGCRDAWFVFDSMLVLVMTIETWALPAVFLAMGNSSGGGVLGNASILRIARLLRLTRMARMARLLRALPELLILIKGMLGAMRSVALTLGLLLMILYVFAITFMQLCAGLECSTSFDGVLKSMHILLVNGALMDGLADISEPLMEENVALLMIFYFFLLLAGLTIMNMLIGVICEVVSAVASTEREAMSLAFVREKIHELINCGDEDDDNAISKQEFMQMLHNHRAMEILSDVGIDVVGLVDFADFIFEPDNVEFLDPSLGEPKEKTLSFSEFMNIIVDMRGSNTATVRDIVDLRKFIKERIVDLGRKLETRLSTSHQEYPRATSSTSISSGVQSRPFSADTKGHFHGLVDSFNTLLTAHEQEISALHAENFRLQELLQNFNKAVIPQMLPLAANPIQLQMRTEGAVHGHGLMHASVTSSTHDCCQDVVRQSDKFRGIQEFKQEILDSGDHAWLPPGPAQIFDGRKHPESSLTLGGAGDAQESLPAEQLSTRTLRNVATAASGHCRLVPSDCWGGAHSLDCHCGPELRPTASYVL